MITFLVCLPPVLVVLVVAYRVWRHFSQKVWDFRDLDPSSRFTAFERLEIDECVHLVRQPGFFRRVFVWKVWVPTILYRELPYTFSVGQEQSTYDYSKEAQLQRIASEENPGSVAQLDAPNELVAECIRLN